MQSITSRDIGHDEHYKSAVILNCSRRLSNYGAEVLQNSKLEIRSSINKEKK